VREARVLHDKLTREIREGPSGPKIAAFFDVDRTLLAGFSAVSFMRERITSGRVGPTELVQGLVGTLSFALGRTGFSGFVSAHTQAYRGITEASMDALGQEVFDKHLATQIFPESRALVRAHRERGHTIAIVSSALPSQVDPVARELGVEHVLCTRLEAKDGVLTGAVAHPTCFGRGKLLAAEDLAEHCDLDLDASYFYTDSIDDLPLLENVGHPRPTNPDRRLAQIAKERRWPVQRFTSRGQPDLEQIARTALAYASLVPSAIAGAAVGLLNRSHREAVNTAGPLWADLSTALAGVDLRVTGEEHLWSHRPAVFIFNHQSGLDAPLILKMVRRDVTGVAKQEIKRNLIFGPLFSAAGVVFVDRADSKKAIEALGPALEALREGRSIAIAPEGTRQKTPKLGRFKKGAFHLAMQAGVPIVPVVFRNVLDALPKDGIVIHPATVEAVVLPPIDTSGWSKATLDDEIEAIRNRFIEVLEG
jgi:putative phosphoserine phosphatase/1-acylglycerol-3-phosphate O-acyltransferase